MKHFLAILALSAPLALAASAGAQQTDKPASIVVAVVDGGKLADITSDDKGNPVLNYLDGTTETWKIN